MTDQTVSNHCRRADGYKFLADCYYFPDDRLLDMLDEFGHSGDERFAQVIQDSPARDDLERHKVDYARLFLGPFKLLAPPYGSVYLEDGKFMSNSTLEVRDLYRQQGLDIILKDAPDHITVELEFMHCLALKEAQAINDFETEQIASLREQQAFFLHRHLGIWVKEFAHRIKTNAQTDFYQSLGRATERFVLEDIGEFRENSG